MLFLWVSGGINLLFLWVSGGINLLFSRVSGGINLLFSRVTGDVNLLSLRFKTIGRWWQCLIVTKLLFSAFFFTVIFSQHCTKLPKLNLLETSYRFDVDVAVLSQRLGRATSVKVPDRQIVGVHCRL